MADGSGRSFTCCAGSRKGEVDAPRVQLDQDSYMLSDFDVGVQRLCRHRARLVVGGLVVDHQGLDGGHDTRWRGRHWGRPSKRKVVGRVVCTWPTTAGKPGI